MKDYDRQRPNSLYVTFAQPTNRTNWVIDVDAVKIFMHSYDDSERSRYLRFDEPNLNYRFYERDCIFVIYDEDGREYVELQFYDVIRLLSLRDRDVTNFSKTLKNRRVNLFTMVDGVLNSKQDVV